MCICPSHAQFTQQLLQPSSSLQWCHQPNGEKDDIRLDTAFLKDRKVMLQIPHPWKEVCETNYFFMPSCIVFNCKFSVWMIVIYLSQVFCVVGLCSLTDSCQRFKQICGLHFQSTSVLEMETADSSKT
jgi:hypothetical protein